MTDRATVLRPEGALLARTIGSPVGPLAVAVSPVGVMQVAFGRYPGPGPAFEAGEAARSRNASIRLAAGLLETTARQLEAYFDGSLRAFDVALDLQGTPFQLRVWAALRALPYGQTLSYGDMARRLGDGNLARAVGAAAGANPVAILVPCHRLVGSGGELTGFAGGIRVKQALLRHESQASSPDLFGGF